MGRKLLGACGLDCADCDAYKATIADDDDMRREVAEKWSKSIGIELHADSIHCRGCMKSETVIDFANECPVRICAQVKRLNNCSECSEFPCEQVKEWHSHMKTDAMKNLMEDIENRK